MSTSGSQARDIQSLQRSVYTLIWYDEVMTGTLEAVLFDVDGTLIDTEKIQSDAFLHVLKQHGHHETELTEHGTVHVPGETTNGTWARLKDRHNIPLGIEELAAHKRKAALESLQTELNPMDGVIRLFDDLHERNIKIAVVSSAQKERLELIIQGLGLTGHVDEVISANDVESVKPAPDPYLMAAKMLGVHTEGCVVIEDAEVGVISAKAAGMKVIAVPNDYTKLMDFSSADMQVESLANISYDELNKLIKS
jgi:HAD superfamily hydrolase (TIGR01509 family)